MRNPSTANAQLTEKTSIPYPGSFVGLTEVISALQTGLYALRARMTESLHDPAPGIRPGSTLVRIKPRRH